MSNTNVVIDIVVLASLIGMVLSGCVLLLISTGANFLGLSKSLWLGFHVAISILFSISITLHFVLHHKWLGTHIRHCVNKLLGN